MPTKTPEKTKPAAKRTRKPKTEADRATELVDQPVEKLLKLLDQLCKARGEAELKVADLTTRITELAAEARRRGVIQETVAQHVQRMDVKERKLKPVTRQAVHTMVATHTGQLPPRTTRASRRKSDPERAGSLNVDALK